MSIPEEENQNKIEIASRRKIIEAGESLFFKFGFRKVSVEEICAAAGVSKMTFYRYFGNKMDLVKSVLADLSEQGMRVYREIMARDVLFEEKIRETIRMKMDMGNRFSDEFLRDVYQEKGGEIMPFMQKLSGDTMAEVMKDYEKARASRQIRQDLRIEFLPYMLNQMAAMVNDPALLAIYGGNLHEVLRELTNLFFYGIIAKPGEGKV